MRKGGGRFKDRHIRRNDHLEIHNMRVVRIIGQISNAGGLIMHRKEREEQR